MSAAYERYLPTLTALMPGLFDVEARERAGLMLLRDQAGQSIAGSCWQSHDAYATVYSLASELALRPMPLEALQTARKALVRMTMAARDLEVAFGERSNG